MITAQDLRGVMGMMPAFATEDAGDLDAASTVDVDKLAAAVDRIIKDGIHIITTTGSFGECYNLFWDEFKLLASTVVEVVNKRVPLFIGSTSPNPREVVQRMKFIEDLGADGTLLGLPYYDARSTKYIEDFYTQIAQRFPKLGILIYHNPTNHKTTIPVSAFHKIVQNPNIVGMKDSHRSTQAFMQIQKITRGKLSIFVNQTQLYPYGWMGAAGCWSIASFMGPWPVLHLWNLVEDGRSEEAQQVIDDMLSGGGRDSEADNISKVQQKLAGYADPGPTRTPIVRPSEEAIERARKKAEHWRALCEKYRPLVEAKAKARIDAKG